MAAIDFDFGSMRELRERLASAWRWWTGELASLVPERILSRFSRPQSRVVLSVSDDTLSVSRKIGSLVWTIVSLTRDDLQDEVLLAAARERLRLEVTESDVVVLRLPGSRVLRKRLRLPLTRGNDLTSLLALDLDRHSPLERSQIEFGYAVLQRDSERGQQDVELRIVEKARLLEIEAEAEKLGLKASAIAFEGENLAAWRIPLAVHMSVKERLTRWAVPALACLVVMLAAANFGLAYLRAERQADALEAQLQTARASAMHVADLRAQIAASERSLTMLPQRRKEQLFLRDLDAISKALPDDAWVYRIDFDGAQYRLSGYAKNASSLIAQFDHSAAFTGAEFRAPVVPAPNGASERFEIVFHARGNT